MKPIAVSLGDPAGVGPELIAECWARRHQARLPAFCVFGSPYILAAAGRQRGLGTPVVEVGSIAEAVSVFPDALPVVVTFQGIELAYTPGVPGRNGAELALDSLEAATEAAVLGQAAAVLTAPIAKARLAEVGFTYPGQTEFVAASCGVAPQDAVMMLAGPSLRTVPLTVHVALAEVPDVLTTDLIIRRARIVARALTRDFGLAAPRLAIAALNPHAGEDGRMGDEEARIITPAIATLQAEGIAVTGPHPADALFAPRARETFDVALCMYHDQALIPLKALDFDHGVNVTLGLPLIRTSPDHGTAFAIAGKGVADPGATIAALRMAAACARHRAAA